MVEATDTDARGRAARKSATAYRTISEVSEALDVPQHVLRFWETKFSQVRPLKRGGGRRYYRPEDIQLLQKIQKLLYEDGYTIKGVQRLLREGKVDDDRETAVETVADLFGGTDRDSTGASASADGSAQASPPETLGHAEDQVDAAAGAAASAAGGQADAEPGAADTLSASARQELRELLTELKAIQAELKRQ